MNRNARWKRDIQTIADKWFHGDTRKVESVLYALPYSAIPDLSDVEAICELLKGPAAEREESELARQYNTELLRRLDAEKERDELTAKLDKVREHCTALAQLESTSRDEWNQGYELGSKHTGYEVLTMLAGDDDA